jgi:hypothetical protein
MNGIKFKSAVKAAFVAAAMFAAPILTSSQALAGSTGAIPAGTTLVPGAAVWSASGRIVLIMQGDGNLVLYNVTTNPWRVLFASGTNGHNNACARMQADGNLVVYPPGCPTTNALWNSGTWGNDTSGPIAYVQDINGNGALSIYGWTNTLLWNSWGFRSAYHTACNSFSASTYYPRTSINYFTDCLTSHDWWDGSNSGTVSRPSEFRNCQLSFPTSVFMSCNSGSETTGNYWETQPQGWSGPGYDNVDWMNSRVTFGASLAINALGINASASFCNYARVHTYPNGTWRSWQYMYPVIGDSSCGQ